MWRLLLSVLIELEFLERKSYDRLFILYLRCIFANGMSKTKIMYSLINFLVGYLKNRFLNLNSVKILNCYFRLHLVRNTEMSTFAGMTMQIGHHRSADRFEFLFFNDKLKFFLG